MVQDHYAKLGFTDMSTDAADRNHNMLDLADFRPAETSIVTTEG
jgi:hypothetical protein